MSAGGPHTRLRPKARSIEAALARGRRVYLRHPTRGDRRDWIDLRLRSRAFLERWDPRPPPGLTIDDIFDRILASADKDEQQRHLVIRRRDEAIVGMVNLNQIFRGPFCNAVLGYWIGEPYARQGYATEGVRLCLRRAFGPLGLHRVEANVMPSNEPSLALVRRLGFREEGYSPRYLQIAGCWADHTRWALTAEDRSAAEPQ